MTGTDADIPTNEIIQGDCISEMSKWPDSFIQCVVTSPPYWGLRDYGVEGQLGLEKTPEEYVAKMVEVFREVRRVLRDDGTLWLNLGDSYNTTPAGNTKPRAEGGNGAGKFDVHGGAGQDHYFANRNQKGGRKCGSLKPKDLCGIPWRVALALQADGWYLRQDIIWSKPNPMPESCRDRCTKSHEYIFLLTKKPRYFYDAQAIAEPSTDKESLAGRKFRGRKAIHEAGCIPNDRGYHDFTSIELGKCYPTKNKRSVWKIEENKTDVWEVTTKSFPDAHFATFPPKLIEPCILAGTSKKGRCPECGGPWERVVEKSGGTTGKSWHDHGKDMQAGQSQGSHPGGIGAKEAGDGNPYRVETLGWRPTCDCGCEKNYVCEKWEPCIVFDPFAGSGTTCVVAAQNGRDYVGIELNPQYVAMACKRLEAVETGVSVKEADMGQMAMRTGGTVVSTTRQVSARADCY
jgi:DNA modification methylase